MHHTVLNSGFLCYSRTAVDSTTLSSFHNDPLNDFVNSSGAEGSHSFKQRRTVSMTNVCWPSFQKRNSTISLFEVHSSRSRRVPLISNVNEVQSGLSSRCGQSRPALRHGLLVHHTSFLDQKCFLRTPSGFLTYSGLKTRLSHKRKGFSLLPPT